MTKIAIRDGELEIPPTTPSFAIIDLLNQNEINYSYDDWYSYVIYWAIYYPNQRLTS